MNFQESAGFVTFTEEILNEKLHFLCSVREKKSSKIGEPNKTLKSILT